MKKDNICDCKCHIIEGMKHIVACCYKCNSCGQNIVTYAREEHGNECKNQKDESTLRIDSSKAEWVNSSFIDDSNHVSVLKDFIKTELLDDKTISLTPSKDFPTISINITLAHTKHWSRQFEWPWVVINSGLNQSDVILDAGGGNGLFQYVAAKKCKTVYNLDESEMYLEKVRENNAYKEVQNIILQKGDLLKMPFQDNFFDKVFCISVLEHIPINMLDGLREMYRVLKPGGTLAITFDIASYSRWNHSIDAKKATEIFELFGLKVPEIPKDIIQIKLDEITPLPNEPKSVILGVLCLAVKKAC